MTLDEFFESSKALMVLRINLETNLKALFPSMPQEDKDVLMRMNLTMIRQCFKQMAGVE